MKTAVRERDHNGLAYFFAEVHEMQSNFSFLKDRFPVLSNFGELAEKYLYSDPYSCLMKLGMIGETIVNLIFTYDRIPLPYDNTAVVRIDALYREGLIEIGRAHV